MEDLKKRTLDSLIATIADVFGVQDWEYDHDTKKDVLEWIKDTCDTEEIEQLASY